MATRREIDDFIREDESVFSDEREPICTCDNCGDGISEDDDMAVVEEHNVGGRPGIRHICMGCWEANGWDKAEELLDMVGLWYWTGDAVSAMQIAGEHTIKEQRRYKQIIGTAVNIGLASVGKGAAT